MKTIFNALQVNYAEYSYFKQLSKSERIQFLFEIYDAAMARQNGGIDLTEFFMTVQEYVSQTSEIKQNATNELSENPDQVAVIIDDTNIMIESNSLRAMRHIIYKFFETGYILQRDKDLEKMFRKDKVTKYLRIFKIVDQISTICTN